MSSLFLKTYHSLPPFGRNLVASLRGVQLRRWRYSAGTERLVQEALAREHWGEEQWPKWEEERMAPLLDRAATRVPFYRGYWSQHNGPNGRKAWSVLENWPILKKEAVRSNPRAFVADDVDPKGLWETHTSGTTGTPIQLFHSKAAVEGRYALYEARHRLWHGVTRHDRWGIIGGQPIVPRDQKRPPFWVWNATMNQLYLSAMHLASWSAQAYLDAISKYRLQYLVGYSSSLYFLAREAKRIGQCLPVKAVVTNAEPLFGFQRQAIKEAFSGTVQETYGQAETVCCASECACGGLHLWPDMGKLELLDKDGNEVAPGSPGQMVATGLLDTAVPLIRYEIGDVGQLPQREAPCPCGRTLPLIEKIWGRLDDQIVTKDGRHAVLIDRIFDPPLRTKEGQIVQRGIDKFLLRVVPDERWTASDVQLLKRSLTEIVGDVDVEVRIVREIERSWMGKARVIVSEMKSPIALGTAGIASPTEHNESELSPANSP